MRRLLLGVALIVGFFMLCGVLLLALIPLGCYFGVIRHVEGVGGFELTVNVTTSGDKLRSVSCEAVGGKREVAEEVAEKLIPPETRLWSTVADPFDGKPLKVHIQFTTGGSCSEPHYHQLRYLVVIGTFQDGRRLGKVVEIPDGRQSKEVDVSFP
jgi:hypothetical protein